MGEIRDIAAEVYRPFVTDGVPASGPNKPSKSEIANLFGLIEHVIAGALAGIVYYSTGATRAADTSKPIGTIGKAADEPDYYRREGSGWVVDNSIYNGVSALVQPLIDALTDRVDDLEVVLDTDLAPETGFVIRFRAGDNILGGFSRDEFGAFDVNALRLAGKLMAPVPAEVTRGYRWTLADRVLMTLDGHDGLRPSKITLPANTLLDGQTATLMELIVSGGVGVLNSPAASFGDSLTQGFGSDTSWTAMLAPELGVDVQNFGIMGQRSIDIAARQNGAPAKLTVSGNVATTAGVAVTARSVNPLYYGGPTSIAGLINGNRCVLSTNGANDPYGVRDGALTLTATDGPFPVPANSIFLTEQGAAARNKVQTFIAGRNDIDWSSYKAPTLDPTAPNYIADPVASTLASHAAAEAYVVPFGGRMLHGAVTLSTDEYDGGPRNPTPARAINAQLATLYGSRYVDLTRPATTSEMAAIGYSPTSNDVTDAGRGVFQRGLRVDAIHPSKQGYRIFHARIAATLYAQGWYK